VGYRLNIETVNKEELFYATKLYGYVDESVLKSHKWLLENGKIDGDEYFSYGLDLEIELDKKEFETFITLYDDDLAAFNPYQNIFPYVKGRILKDEGIIKALKEDKVIISWL
jgi:hypothetical protein